MSDAPAASAAKEDGSKRFAGRPGIPARWANLFACVLIDLVLLAASPILLLVWIVATRFFTRPKLSRGLIEKAIGFPRRSSSRPLLWVHAVSVGEVLIAEPLVSELARRFPGCEIVVSVSTFTGREVAEKRLPGHRIFYAPLDASPFVLLAMRRLEPSALLLVELEVWPILVLTARRRGVPVLVVNGRMTERSARGYRRLGPLSRALFRQVSAWAIQNDAYAARLRDLGVPSERVSVLGNIKHDREAGVEPEEGSRLRSELGWPEERTLVLVAGSTHPGEEELFAKIHSALSKEVPELRLVLVPRHVERLASAGEISRWNVSVPIVRLSELRARAESERHLGEEVLLVDTVGDLERFYAAADVVAVGGTWTRRGGHNVLEPARLGKPIVIGPSYENFRDEVDCLLQNEAIVIAEGEEAVSRAIRGLLADRGRRLALSQNARAATGKIRGALARHGDWLEGHITLLGVPKS